MKQRNDLQIRAIHDLICRQLLLAEDKLRISLAELSRLDEKISKLVVDRARIVGGDDDLTAAFASLEARRRAGSIEIAVLKQQRVEAVTACDESRGEARRLLRRKIALDGILSRLAEDEKERSRRA
ncbi:MAG: hypothetical protein ACKVS5_09060 [Parvularculaceae bacterium]